MLVPLPNLVAVLLWLVIIICPIVWSVDLREIVGVFVRVVLPIPQVFLINQIIIVWESIEDTSGEVLLWQVPIIIQPK